ncbi:hypothetical protein M8C21_023425, partial [Ambrosia artemisiifolia]
THRSVFLQTSSQTSSYTSKTGCNNIRTDGIWESFKKAIDFLLHLHWFCSFSHRTRSATKFPKVRCNWHTIGTSHEKESL